MTTRDEGWKQLEESKSLRKHNFVLAPYHISAEEIKEATNNKEPRILCYHDTEEKRPQLFQELGLFVLPIRNGKYVVLQGEGYVHLPPVYKNTKIYMSKLDFELETSKVGNSEMQHLDFAYATSLIRTFMRDNSLLLTIRGRKRAPEFSFRVGEHELIAKGVQTEVDAGYEGQSQIVLVEAKNRNAKNVIIRQLFYPFRMWAAHTNKEVNLLLFERYKDTVTFWQYSFRDKYDYNSIHLERSEKFRICESSYVTKPSTSP